MHLVLAKEMQSAISFDFASRDFGVLSDSEPKSKPKKNKMQLESSRFFPAASTRAGSAGTHESVATPNGTADVFSKVHCPFNSLKYQARA
jgi:hypothetical protein